MKLRLICVGKPASFHRAAIDEYGKRIGRYLPLETIELKEEKGGRKPDPDYIRSREGERILERIAPRSFVIVLDERGQALSSEGVAELLNTHMVEGTSELALIIGGAYGLSPEVKRQGDLRLSLSAMTLPHQLARMLLLEQLYRGLTILRNEPYHNR